MSLADLMAAIAPKHDTPMKPEPKERPCGCSDCLACELALMRVRTNLRRRYARQLAKSRNTEVGQ